MARIRRPQLRTRVLVGVLAVVLAVLASFGYAAVTALHRYMLAETDISLGTVLADYESSLTPTLGAPVKPGSHVPSLYPKGGSRPTSSPATGNLPRHLQIPASLDEYNVEVKTGQGRLLEVVQGNVSLIPRLPDDLTALVGHVGGQTVQSRDGAAQLRLRASSAHGETLIVTTSLESLNRTINRLTVIVVVSMLAAALLVLAGVGSVVRRGLRPVKTMAAAADKITAGDLTSRVSPHDPATEVGRLGAALNGMLTRIQTAVQEREASDQAARQFFADASHELRTPLASLRANAELYQQGALPRRTQVDEAMRRIAAEARRMGVLVDDMLRLARLDQRPRQENKPVDLTVLTVECAERAHIASPERTWQTHVAPGLVTVGDEEMLRRAVDNLLGNVVAHTPAGTTATISAAADEAAITIEVSDDGPGLSASQLPRIFDRFYRGPAQAHHHGSGLGLAIVSAIAAEHHGTAEATPNHPRGLRVILKLPISRPDRSTHLLDARARPEY
jgi:two-component system, OmpR family, sensor kinase